MAKEIAAQELNTKDFIHEKVEENGHDAWPPRLGGSS
jgi:hypothetical protein